VISFDEIKAPENRGLLGLAVMRISVGYLFLATGWGKISREGGFADGMMGFLGSSANMPDWYRSFVEGVIAPNADIFATLVGFGEVALAISLITGIMVRYASIGALFMIANFMFAKGAAFWSSSNHDSLYIFIFIVLMTNPSGRFLGLESWAREKFPGLPG
jgi:thiosulfate dehydrogenase (quinone) large subunit